MTMTTTTMTDQQMVDAMILECSLCRENGTYVPKATRLTLFTHGLMVLRFFCVHCYEMDHQVLRTSAFADQLTQLGVPTTVVRTPMELFEHPDPKVPAITKGHCTGMERLSLEMFNRVVDRELRLERP
jgi:hypothetical protein